MTKKHTGSKRKLYLTALVVYISCLSFTFLVMKLEKNLSIYNPVHIFFRDFDFTDFYYKINKNALAQIKVGNIVIVNSQCATKAKIASLISAVNNAKPEEIGVDYWFTGLPADSTDSVNALKLDSVIFNSNNLVLGFELPADTSRIGYDNDSLIPGTVIKKLHNETGFINLSDGISTIRSVPLIKKHQDKLYNSLAFALAEKDLGMNNDALKALENDEKKIRIKYIPDSAFRTYNGDSVLKNWQSFESRLKGKIILIGESSYDHNSCGNNDKHFTPLNAQLGGRSFPDMEGVYVHANILYNLLGQAYIYEPAEWVITITTLLLFLILLPLMMVFYVKHHTFFHFGMALIYEPLIFLSQIFFAVFFYSFTPGVYIQFEIPFLMLFIAPFAIYIVDFLDLLLDKLLKLATNGEAGSPSYFSMHRVAHFSHNKNENHETVSDHK